MAQLTAISHEQHAHKRWKRYTSYSFAADEAVAPLVVQELPRACLSLPIGFVKRESGFQLVAVQGLQSGQNLWVTPDGKWLGGYVPAVYRGYPFALANAGEGRRVLCVREESGLINDMEGEPFFDAEGQATKPVQDVMAFLEQLSVNARLTARMCTLLEEHGLIQPWSVKLRVEDAERNMQGLYRVDEAALNALPMEALDALSKGGALAMIYCQLLSMQHLQRFGELASRHAATNEAAASRSGDLDLEFLKDGGNIQFS